MKKLILCLFFVLLFGCTRALPPLPVSDTERFTIRPIALVGSDQTIAVAADGRMVAWTDGGLNLYDLETNSHNLLLDLPPNSLCWSPDGIQLAAVIRVGDAAHLHVFDRTGAPVFDERLSGQVNRLQWSLSGKLIAGILSHKTYKFGTHISGHLLQWDDQWRKTATPLFETTITPGAAALLAGRLFEVFDFDLSVFEDEVLYTRLHAPPAFSASRHLVLHNLQTHQEKQISSLPLLSGKGRLMVDGESFLIEDGSEKIRKRGLWTNKTVQEWSANQFDYDVSSNLMVTDGSLFQGEQVLVSLPPGNHVKLSFAGNFLLIEWEKGLYLLSGYPVTAADSIDGAVNDKLLKLRRLRSRDLIEYQEYLQAKERLLR